MRKTDNLGGTIMDMTRIAFYLEQSKDLFIHTSNTIWEYAETRFEEHKSSKLQADVMKRLGFEVCFPSSSLPTAFRARYGTSGPVIGILGEYDALPGLSQKADCPVQQPLIPQGSGHGCGHNLLGTAGMAAALAVRHYIEDTGICGSVVYYGCPGEENGAGKALMIEEHFFDEADIMLSWHPHYKSGLFNNSLANVRVTYTFHGKSAHASLAPHLGRSALDACELMNIGVNYLREHMIPDARVHYAYLNTGGTAPNIIPAEAQVFYAIRAPKDRDTGELKERVDNIAQGAALMTGTQVTIKQNAVYRSFLPNSTLDQLLIKHLKASTPICYTEEEIRYARAFQLEGSLPHAKLSIDPYPDLTLDRKSGISTDAGNVSWEVPSGSFMVNCYANGSPLHHWTVTAQGKASIAHKGMLTASRIISSAAAELLENPELLQNAREDFKKAKSTVL